MKKPIVKIASMLLVLVLLLSALPLTAFAAETDGHIHTDACPQGDHLNAKICKHSFVETFASRDVPYDETYHLSYEVLVHTCLLCGYAEREETGNVRLSAHKVTTWVLISQSNGMNHYRGSCILCNVELSLEYPTGT